MKPDPTIHPPAEPRSSAASLASDLTFFPGPLNQGSSKSRLLAVVADTFKSLGILAAATVVGLLFQSLGFADANIITVYLLAVLITSTVTNNRIYGLVASIVNVLVFNFLFTEPKFTLHAYGQGYPMTFLIMFLAAFLTGTLTVKLKDSARQSAQAAYRTRVLFETSQLLQQAENPDDIRSKVARQLVKLLNRNVIVYPAKDDHLDAPLAFPVNEAAAPDLTSGSEQRVADLVFHHKKRAGATTHTFPHAKCLYLAVRANENVFGVVGIDVGSQPLDTFEDSILLSILGECALALENEKNAREKEEAAILAKNEQLRANLLRAISHDLRTPLTSISGNASNLLSNGASFDEATKQALYEDIYQDSMWLINLVENLLSVTRLDEGRLNLHLSAELVDEVITEALRHLNYVRMTHTLTVQNQEDFLLAKMDARLIVQVIINLVDNAVKYTPAGSEIRIAAHQAGSWAVISISDNGPGIPDEAKDRVFDRFYSGANKIADSRRSLGLGLSLCKSIVNAHGGSITVTDNAPHGAVFTFTLPIEEVQLHE